MRDHSVHGRYRLRGVRTLLGGPLSLAVRGDRLLHRTESGVLQYPWWRDDLCHRRRVSLSAAVPATPQRWSGSHRSWRVPISQCRPELLLCGLAGGGITVGGRWPLDVVGRGLRDGERGCQDRHLCATE